MNRLSFVLSGTFELSRAVSSNNYDELIIGTFKPPTDIGLTHIGRQYGFAVKEATRNVYMMDLTGSPDNILKMWAYGATGIYSGDSFAFSVVGLFI